MDPHPEKTDLKSIDISAFNRDKLKQLFPMVFTETRDEKGELVESIDFEKLKAELGTFSDVFEARKERYGMDWPGKKDAMKLIQEPSRATLKSCPDESVNFDTSENLFIEGDNLETLKLLQKSYYGKIKMIYIDPPYNTGNDFIYPDNYQETIETYLMFAGLLNDQGRKYSTNSPTDGRFHTRWLNMMLPRLYLARNLLKEDGVIFISIDDRELHNLRQLCDYIFGEENFVNLIIIKAKPSAGASGGGEDVRLKKNVEYILGYCKNREDFGRFNEVYEEIDLFDFIEEYKEEGKSWKYTRVLVDLGEEKPYSEIKDGAGEKIKIFKHENVEIKTISKLAEEQDVTEEDIYIKYFDKVFRDTNAQSSIRTRVIEATREDDEFVSIEYIPRSGRNKGSQAKMYYKGSNKDLIAWLRDVAEKKGSSIVKKEKVGTLWQEFNWNNVTKEGKIKFPNGKKPIELIKKIDKTFMLRR